jgi:hypothetical protein
MKLALISLFLFAASPKPGSIPDALKAKFFQAQAKMISANAQAMEAQRTARENASAFSQVKDEVDKACGEGYQAITDGDDNLSCTAVAKPVVKEPEPKKPTGSVPPGI